MIRACRKSPRSPLRHIFSLFQLAKGSSTTRHGTAICRVVAEDVCILLLFIPGYKYSHGDSLSLRTISSISEVLKPFLYLSRYSSAAFVLAPTKPRARGEYDELLCRGLPNARHSAKPCRSR